MSYAPLGVEDDFPSPKRQAAKGPGGDPSIDEVSSGSGRKGSNREGVQNSIMGGEPTGELRDPRTATPARPKVALAPETRISSDVPSCAPAGNYGIHDDDLGCYAAEEETSGSKD